MATGKSKKAAKGNAKLNGKHVNGASKKPTVTMKTGDGTEIEAQVVDGRDDLIGSDNGPTPEPDVSPAAASVSPPPKMPPRTRELRCLLTDAELAAVGASLATTHEKIDDVDAKIDALGEQVKTLKKERDVLEAAASGQARAYRGRCTYRQVPCHEVPGLELNPRDPTNPREGMLTVREDLGEPFEWREFSTADRQGSLFDEGETQHASDAL